MTPWNTLGRDRIGATSPRATGVVLALALALPWPGRASALESTMRYRCTLADGSAKVFLRDLSRDFHIGVSGCTPVAVPATAERAAPAAQPAEQESFFSSGIVTVSAARRTNVPAARGMPAQFAGWLGSACRRHGIDLSLAAAVMYAESRYRADARSPAGALGLMQLMPATAARYGVRSEHELLDPRTNIEIGVRYLRDLVDMFPGRADLAVAAYNAGEGAVLKHGLRVPPYRETERYVEQVLSLVAGAD